MEKIIIFILLVLFMGCKMRDDFSQNNAITNVITIQDGCGGTKIYEFELRDGTKCVVLNDKAITCAWDR